MDQRLEEKGIDCQVVTTRWEENSDGGPWLIEKN
jgi:hypothetical protein